MGRWDLPSLSLCLRLLRGKHYKNKKGGKPFFPDTGCFRLKKRSNVQIRWVSLLSELSK